MSIKNNSMNKKIRRIQNQFKKAKSQWNRESSWVETKNKYGNVEHKMILVPRKK